MSRRILVVDDNVDSAESLAMLLRFWGHEVQTAADGPKALEAAGTFQPEVVLLDISLPGMDGFQVAQRLRAQEQETRKMLLIALTGYSQEDDRRRSLQAGFDQHLVKPVDPAALEMLLALADIPSGRCDPKS